VRTARLTHSETVGTLDQIGPPALQLAAAPEVDQLVVVERCLDQRIPGVGFRNCRQLYHLATRLLTAGREVTLRNTSEQRGKSLIADTAKQSPGRRRHTGHL
jgi:hypothetical protein